MHTTNATNASKHLIDQIKILPIDQRMFQNICSNK